MKTFTKILSIVLSTFTFFLLNSNKTNAQCNTDDWNALKALYESTNGDYWTNRTGWDVIIDNLNSPPANCSLSTLFGITTENGRVTCIDLDGENNCNYSVTEGNNLVGNLPPELSNLTSLTHLRMSNNQLAGNFPIELQNLNNLTHLVLESNQFSGEIPPGIGNFASLQIIRLAQNQFTGSLPDEIGDLINLTQLWLGNNQFSGGIPSSIGDLVNLNYLDLGGNQFTGSIPSSIGNLNNLLSLSINDTQINDLSVEIGSLSSLKGLNISNTQINSIPTQFENLASLESLYMNNIELMQTNIPPQIWNLSNLKVLALQNNGFIGNISTEIGSLTNLEGFDIRGNSLYGEIPASFANLTKLRGLTFSSNSFVGDVLDIIVNFPNLESFHASSNQFTGNIPSSIGNLTQLKEISLQNNRFSGILPTELGTLDELELITLGQNQFEGCYPNSMVNYCDHTIYNTNIYMSDGNNFDTDWEDFCSDCSGACDNEPCQENNETSVYPGDLNHDGIVNNQDIGLSGLFLFEIGPQRAAEHQNTDWYAHPATDWNRQQINNEDIKHFDCNGDGAITIEDRQAIEDNMGETWSTPQPVESVEESNYQIVLHPLEEINDNFLRINVALEHVNGGNLTLQGGYFTINYGMDNQNITNATMNFFPEPWIGIPDLNLTIYDHNDTSTQTIEIGFSLTDGIDAIGNGVIGVLILQLDNTVARNAKQNDCMLQIAINNIGMHDSQPNNQPVENRLLQINMCENTCKNTWSIGDNTQFQNEYESNNLIETNGFLIIGDEQQVEYRSNRVCLQSRFKVKAGASFKAGYGSCN